MIRSPLLSACLSAAALAGAAPAQTTLEMWGNIEAHESYADLHDIVQVAATDGIHVALRSNGELIFWGLRSGTRAAIDAIPTGVRCVEVAVQRVASMHGRDSTFQGAILRSDGQVTLWGEKTGVATPPPGIAFSDIKVADDVVTALRSDGRIAVLEPGLCFGTVGLPMPAGTRYVAHTLTASAVALRSDGAVVSRWIGGANVSIPPLVLRAPGTSPPVRSLHYVNGPMGFSRIGLILADGSLELIFPDPNVNVPQVTIQPDVGTNFVDVAGDLFQYFGVALQDDGRIKVWGAPPPWIQALQPGTPRPWVEIELGYESLIARRSDGAMDCVDPSGTKPGGFPTRPTTAPIRQLALDGQSYVVLFEDGEILTNRENGVRPSPPGASPVWIGVGGGRVGILFNNGAYREDQYWPPFPPFRQRPPLPTGLTYQQVSPAANWTLALRSDGSVVSWGADYPGLHNIPPLPAGFTYTKVAAGSRFGVALRSDMTAVFWGQPPGGQTWPTGRIAEDVWVAGDQVYLRWKNHTFPVLALDPALGPYSVSDDRFGTGVELQSHQEHVLLRSPSRPLEWTHPEPGWVWQLPQLDPGLGMLELDFNRNQLLASIGVMGHYRRLQSANGCSPKWEQRALQPLDRPRVGRDLAVQMVAPLDFAVLGTGASAFHSAFGPLPLDLSPQRLPGCWLHTSLDLLTPAVGLGGTATAVIPIPNDPRLLGQAFFQQAWIPSVADPSGRPARISDAYAGVIGAR